MDYVKLNRNALCLRKNKVSNYQGSGCCLVTAPRLVQAIEEWSTKKMNPADAIPLGKS
jgi:hypothetical protein